MNRCTLVCFALLVVLGMGSAALAIPKDKPNGGERALKVLVVDVCGEPIAARLRKLKFDVVLVGLKQLELDQRKDIDVVLLPTGWAQEPDLLKKFEDRCAMFHRFVQRGHGLLVCQPNPLRPGKCTPELLPYPITFQNHYDDKEPGRVNLAQDHFITEDLPDRDMPFPADPILEIDPRYKVLAKQKSTGWPSLAVCTFGDGRVVVQTANETYGATIPQTDEILRRMVVWAAGR
jgi:hypothetical protein